MATVHSSKPRLSQPAIGKAALWLGIMLAAAAAGVLAVGRPLWGAGLVIAAVSAVVIVRFPNTATLLGIFILYTNLADVAVTFHGVPYFVGASFLLLFFIPLAYYLFVRREGVIVAPALPLMLLYLAIHVVSAACSDRPEVAFRSVLMFLVEGVAVFFLITNVIRTPRMLKAAVWTLLAAGVLLGAVPLFQQLTGTFDNQYGGLAQTNERGFKTGEQTVAGEMRQRRSTGSIGEQNRFAQIMLMLVPLGIACYRAGASRAQRVLAVAATFFALAGVVLAFSRGAAVAAALALAIAAALGYVNRKQFLALALAGVVILLAVPQYRHRLASIPEVLQIAATRQRSFEESDGAVRGRLTAMAASAQVFLDHPVVGVGPGMLKHYTKEYGESVGLTSRTLEGTTPAHMIFLDVAGEMGLPGLVCCLAIVIVTLRHLARARQRVGETPDGYRFITTGLLFALVAYLTTGLFLHFAFIRFFWLMMALAAAAGTLNVVDRRVPAER